MLIFLLSVLAWITCGLYLTFVKIPQIDPIDEEYIGTALVVACIGGPIIALGYIGIYVIDHDDYSGEIDGDTRTIIKEAVMKLLGEEPKKENKK